MGRPLKIKKSTTIDIGFNDFGNVEVPVIPVGMTTTQFLGVVGGANTSIATSDYPVVKINANVNGQSGAAYIITQKGSTKYLVSGEDSVNAGSFTPGFSYQITALGNTNWTSIGAGINPQVGAVFTATDVGAGSGTASDAGQCLLVAGATINSGEMNMTFEAGGANIYASRLTNKYIWDGSTPPTRYAVNFFAPESVGNNISNVAATSTVGTFSSAAFSAYNVGDTMVVSGTLSAAPTLATVAITGIAGQFSCAAASKPLVVGQKVTISGTYGGGGSITGYTDPKTYYIIVTNGSTTFTLSAAVGGVAITTTAGTPSGLTYTLTAGAIAGYSDPTTYYITTTNGSTTFTLSTVLGGSAVTTTAGQLGGLVFTHEGAVATTAKSGADAATWTNTTGDLNIAKVNNYTS